MAVERCSIWPEPQPQRLAAPQPLARARPALLAVCLVAASATPSGAQDAKGNAQAGQLVFNNTCRTCHVLREGDNRLGPNLHAIVGRKAGAAEGYAYSSALKGADLVWDRATLDRFIAVPDEVVPGNTMKPYTGMTSAEDRANLIAYLESRR